MWNKTVLTIAAICSIFVLLSCDKNPKKIELVINNKVFSVEVARTNEEMSLGLMFRKHLGEYEGMIFVYTEYVRGAFWMRNTEIPLSIAFITKEGRIVDIRDMVPFSEEPIAPPEAYVYALEVNKGAFSKLGIKVGDFLKIPSGL
jgi:uncharacterized protein